MCSHLSMPSTKPSDFGYGRAKPLVALFGRPVPVTKGDQGAPEQRHAAQYVHWPGTGFCRQWADHPGGEHVMRNLQAHRLVKEAQHRFVEEPIFELEARAEGFLADEYPNCPAHGLRVAAGLEMRLQVCRCRQGEFFADAVPDMLRDSRPKPFSLHIRRSKHGRPSRGPSANGGGPGSRTS